MKFHVDDQNAPQSNRSALHEFYDHFGESQVFEDDSDPDSLWSYEEDPDYADVKLSWFRLKQKKPARKPKQAPYVHAKFGKTKAPAPASATGGES